VNKKNKEFAKVRTSQNKQPQLIKHAG